MAVKVIDKATSPFANLVNIFDVTPPGAAAIIITPIAISGGVFKIIIIRYATIGRIINCEKKPTKKFFGVFNILVKSSTFKPKPNPSIINASMIGATFVTISIDPSLKYPHQHNIYDL